MQQINDGLNQHCSICLKALQALQQKMQTAQKAAAALAAACIVLAGWLVLAGAVSTAGAANSSAAAMFECCWGLVLLLRQQWQLQQQTK
jgi:hypothetical protein